MGAETSSAEGLLPLIATAEPLTREVFGNISPLWQAVFYVLSALSVTCFGYGCYRRWRLWRLGKADGGGRLPIREMAKRFVTQVLSQRPLMGRGLASVAHVLLFSGFFVLFMGTTLLEIEHLSAQAMGRAPGNPVFHKGVYFIIYEFTLDTFGLALLAGCVLFAKRRLKLPPSVAHNPMDWVILGLFFTTGVTGYLVEGLRILWAHTPDAGVSFVGYALAKVFTAAGLSATAATNAHFAMWWVHAILSLGLIAAFPYTRLLHVVAGGLNVVAHPKQLGAMTSCSMDEFEKTGTVGAGRIQDFTRRQLQELDACVSCGRCQDACPAFEAGKPLSPRDVVQGLRGYLDAVGSKLIASAGAEAEVKAANGIPSIHGETIKAETLWACTTCHACVDVCPLNVRPMELITDMRRFLVAEGQLRGSPATALQKMQRSGNPWGLPAVDRLRWAAGLNVPTVESNPGFEVLYWVGCAAAYEPRSQKTARSIVQLLQAAGVNFAVLGAAERCTGESARRMGDEFLFQELAQGNIETLTAHGVRKILTACPHCLNSFKQDYPQFGGRYEIVHHSQFLSELAAQGRLPLAPSAAAGDGGVTYHDPCYLARVNGIIESPRALLRAALGGNSARLTEMPRHGCQTSCCGAGGGRMWFEDKPGERIGRSRIEEALATGAKTVAVGCPFCRIMISDGLAAKDAGMQVKDLAEIMLEALNPRVESALEKP